MRTEISSFTYLTCLSATRFVRRINVKFLNYFIVYVRVRFYKLILNLKLILNNQQVMGKNNTGLFFLIKQISRLNFVDEKNIHDQEKSLKFFLKKISH